MMTIGPARALLELRNVQDYINVLRQKRVETRWFEWTERRRIDDSIHEQQNLADTYRARIPERAAEKVANRLILNAWTQCRRELSFRNPFHRESIVQLPELVGVVVEAARNGTVYEASSFQFGQFGQFVSAAQLPEVQELLTSSYAEEFVLGRIEWLVAIADDPTMYEKQEVTRSGRVLTVQHARSGLRAEFMWSPGETIGKVMSKSYRIASIGPGGDQASTAWEAFTGLGIGRTLYRAGARRLPDLRWGRSGSVSTQAEMLRIRLHREDPWIWSGDCDWCASRDMYWTQATPGDFAGHPSAGDLRRT